MEDNCIIKQNIPWYKNQYLNEKDWLIKKSQYYIFHYFKDSLAEKDIENIINIQEQNRREILKILKLKNKRKINYYLYPSEKIKQSLMGDNGYGNAVWIEIKKNKYWNSKKFEVHAIYNKKIKCIGPHEDTHLLSLPLGVSIFLFCEGLAEFMDKKWHGKDIDIWAKKYLKKDKIYPIKFLINNKNWDKINDMIVYPQSGSFVRYLIKIYGLEKFKKVYKELSRKNTPKENIEIIEKNYSKSINEIEQNWKDYLIHIK